MSVSVSVDVPSRRIDHPLPLAAVALLVLNDHVFKGGGILPAWLTGKLSDVAGLFFFPVLLVSIAAPLRASRVSPKVAAAITAVAFAAIKLVPPVNALVARAWGAMTMDATDLVALPMCALAAIWMTGAPRRPCQQWQAVVPAMARNRRPWRRFLAMVTASLASVATSAIHYPPCRELPLPAVHMTWDQTCMTLPPLTVRLSPGLAHLTMPLRPRVPGCASPIRAVSLEWQATPDVHAVVAVPPRSLPTQAPIEQEAMIDATIDLPYPAQCASLVVRVLSWSSQANQDVVIDTPVASCTEGP